MEKKRAELIKDLESIQHPNISITVYPPELKLKDLESFQFCYPLIPSQYALLELTVNDGMVGLSEETCFKFLSRHIHIRSTFISDWFYRSDDYMDAKGSHSYLIFEKTGIKEFALEFDELSNKYQITLHIGDGNIYRSVGFSPKAILPDHLIPALNKALEIVKWK